MDLGLDLGQVPTRRDNLSGYGNNMDRHTSLCWLKASDLAIQAKQPRITASCPRAGHTTHSTATSHVLIDLMHAIIQYSTSPIHTLHIGQGRIHPQSVKENNKKTAIM